ncbi:MAG: hypothetical protein NT062_05300, partial [Proteobacteria bacterium]|nr:hypothetical protein [Pseudomonadota bacterium]
MRRLPFLISLITTCTLGPRASANPDHRPQDRFSFGLSGGTDVDGGTLAGMYETSYWPNDWIGLGTIVSVSTAETYDVGAELVLAVPLRWVQPYGGVEAGLRTTPTDVAAQRYLFAGINAYASRNLRFFVEARDVPNLMGGTHDELILAGLRS